MTTVDGARPVDAGERVLLLDVIRGFALGGVFLANVTMWFSGRPFLPIEQLKASAAEPVNAIAGHALGFFVFGKFFTLFSFLFGLGFSVQLMRAEDRGRSVLPLYLRRLGILVMIGAAHLCALWYGDILHLYALLGVVLLAFRRRSNRTLLLWGFLLALLVPPAVDLAAKWLPRLWTSPEALAAAADAAKAQSSDFKAKALSVFSGSSYLAIVRTNPVVHWETFIRPSMVGFYGGVIGRFLLGFYVGRQRLLHDVLQHRPLWRRVLLWGLLAGVLGNGIRGALGHLTFTGRISPDTALPQIIGPVAGEIGLVGLAAFYIAAIALLFQRQGWRRVLSVLAPVGQMAVSNYLTESVLGMLVFYGIGIGLIGKADRIACIAIVFGLFTVQIIWSHLWLARFRFGPMEWLWRSLTYGKVQLMRKAPASPPASFANGLGGGDNREDGA